MLMFRLAIVFQGLMIAALVYSALLPSKYQTRAERIIGLTVIALVTLISTASGYSIARIYSP